MTEHVDPAPVSSTGAQHAAQPAAPEAEHRSGALRDHAALIAASVAGLLLLGGLLGFAIGFAVGGDDERHPGHDFDRGGWHHDSQRDAGPQRRR